MGRVNDHSLLIHAGAASVSSWRAENPGVRIEAPSLSCERLNLSGIDLSESIITRAYFDNCDLSHARFAGADLSDATFRDCDLSSTDFAGATLNGACLVNVELDDARFPICPSLSRLSTLSLRKLPTTEPDYDPFVVRPIDRWMGWERLRFLATVRIFVPAYASLTLSVIYINGISWYDALITRINALANGGQLSHASFEPIAPGWTHLAVVISFALLAIAATTFLACPARVVEFTRERWVSDLKQPRLLYDHATWRLPWLRLTCAISLILGGIISAVLLVRAILQQTIFIISSVT